MTCDEAIRSILEADPVELEGRGNGPLSAHLQSCPRCRALATKVLREQDALAAALSVEVPETDLDAVLERAAEASRNRDDGGGQGSSGGQGRDRTGPGIGRFRRLALALAPLAAAAALAILLYQPPSRSALPGRPYRVPPEEPGLELEVSDDARVAVLPTNNPEITVVWFF